MRPWFISQHSPAVTNPLHPANTLRRMRAIFYTLRQLKASLRATMYSERESSLAVMNIHYDKDIDVDAVIEFFAQTHPRCLFLTDFLSTDWETEQLYNWTTLSDWFRTSWNPPPPSLPCQKAGYTPGMDTSIKLSFRKNACLWTGKVEIETFETRKNFHTFTHIMRQKEFLF